MPLTRAFVDGRTGILYARKLAKFQKLDGPASKIKLCQKSKGLAYENTENRYPVVPYAQK